MLTNSIFLFKSIFIMLKYKINMLNKEWRYNGLFSQNAKYIPARSGVYLILELKKRVLNVPIGIDVYYVGKAKKLRNRFRSHYNFIKEHNQKLSKLILNKKLEFWFIEVNEDELDYYETVLIQKMDTYNPNLTNVIKMKNRNIQGENYV